MIFDSSVNQLLFSDKLVSISTSYGPDHAIFGFASHDKSFRLHEGNNYSAWNTLENDNTYKFKGPVSGSSS